MSTKCYVCKKTEIKPIQVYNKKNQSISAVEILCDYCGKYQISKDAIDFNVLENYSKQTFLLSAAIFKKTALGEITELTTSSIPELIKTANRKPPFEIIDDMIEYVCQKADSIIDEIELSEKDIPRFVLKDKHELFEYISQISKLGYWDLLQFKPDPTASIFKRKVKLTLNGWKLIEEIRKTKVDSNQAFVAMWFDDSMDLYYKKGIKPALEKTDFNPIINVKEIQHNEQIDDLIIAHIRKSGLLIADFTGNRPAVYYEAGFAKGLNIPVIWLCRKSNEGDLSFDTRQYNHIVWNDEKDLQSQLITRIAATIPGHLPK